MSGQITSVHPQSAGSGKSHQGARRMPLISILMTISPSWLFLISGLILVSSVMLIPAWRDVQNLRQDRDSVAASAEMESRRLSASKGVLAAVEAGDDVVTSRLVSWQLNLLPEGDRAVARSSYEGGVLGWIDASVAPVTQADRTIGITSLEALVSGSARLWILGIGGLMVFAGIIGSGSRESSLAESPLPSH